MQQQQEQNNEIFVFKTTKMEIKKKFANFLLKVKENLRKIVVFFEIKIPTYFSFSWICLCLLFPLMSFIMQAKLNYLRIMESNLSGFSSIA